MTYMNKVEKNRLKVSIVIPAYNEEKFIAETIRKCKAVMKQNAGLVKAFEIIVVDDGCDDNTADLAAQAGIRLLAHPHNSGYGRSLKDGIEAAQYDTIIIADADGTYPLEAMPELLRAYLKGFNMAVGCRQGKHLNETFFKKILRLILKILVEFTTGRMIPDINSGLRIFSRREIIAYFPRLCDTFSFTTSLTLAYMMTGMFVTYIPIAYYARIGQSKIRIFHDSLRTLQYIVEAILFYNPLKIFLVFDILLLMIAVVNFAIAFYFQIVSAYIIAIGSLLLMFVMFALGLIAVLLKQIMSANNRH